MIVGADGSRQISPQTFPVSVFGLSANSRTLDMGKVCGLIWRLPGFGGVLDGAFAFYIFLFFL